MSISLISPSQATWKETHLNTVAQHIVPEVLCDDGNLKWGRLIGTWNEKIPEGNTLTHTYASCIDCRSGELYFDCNPSMIFRKCFVQLLHRPLHIIAKTIYHAAMIPLLTNLPKLFKGKKSIGEVLHTTLLSIADIIRTPIYGLAIMAASIYAIANAIFNPHSLYDGRKLIGEIEEEANWNRKHTFWTLSKCFQPYPIEILSTYELHDFSNDTVYPSNSSFDRQITNFIRSRIRHGQKSFNLFSCSQLQKGEQYISPVLLDKRVASDEKNLPIYANIL